MTIETASRKALHEVILAHPDPGLTNWIGTEGKLFGLVFWRSFMVEGEVETPQARVVKFSEPGN